MNNFGRQTLTIGQQNTYITGVGWEYLTVINESPFILQLSMTGMGSIDFPAWFQGDIPIPDRYTGQLSINPINYLGLTQLVSQLVSVNGWSKDELKTPQWVALSQNFGNVVTATATNLVNTGLPPSSTPVINVQEAGANGYQIYADNQGNFYIQDYTGSVLTTILRTIAGGGAGTTDLLLGDNARQIQANGQMHTKGRLWVDSEMTVQDGNGPGGGGGGNVALLGQIFNNNNRGVEISPNGGVTGFIDFQGDGSGVNNTGTAFVANGTLLGMLFSGCYGGIQMTGLQPNPGIDLSGLTSGSGISFVGGPNPQVLTGGGGAFASGNGSVAGTINVYCAIWTAGLKVAIVQMNGFNTATQVTLNLPGTVTNCFVCVPNVGASVHQFQLNGGSAVGNRHMYAIGASGGGTGSDEAQTQMKSDNFYSSGNFNQVACTTTGAQVINSLYFFFGV